MPRPAEPSPSAPASEPAASTTAPPDPQPGSLGSAAPSHAESRTDPGFDVARLPAVLDVVEDGIVVQALDGTPVYANLAAARLMGFGDVPSYLRAPRADVLARFRVFDEAGRELEASDLPGRQVGDGLDRESRVVRYVDAATGRTRWSDVSAVAVRDLDGTVRHLAILIRDVTDRKRVEQELADEVLERATLAEAREALLVQLDGERSRLETILQAIPIGVTVADAPDGRVVFSNSAAERILGARPLSAAPPPSVLPMGGLAIEGTRDGVDASGGRATADSGSVARAVAAAEWPLGVTVRTGRAVPSATIPYRRDDGTRGRLAASSAPITDRSGRTTAAVVVFDDVTRQQVAREQAEFLSEASGILAGSLEAEESVRRVARMAVPLVADWCAFEIVGEAGGVDVIALEHADPGRVEHLRLLRARADAGGPRETATSRVLRTGRSELVTSIGDEQVDAAVPDELRRATSELGLSSYVCAPMIVNGRVIGTLTLATEGPARRLEDADVSFAEILAARAGTAIETARLFEDAARLRVVVDTIDDVVEMFDPRTLRITYVNHGTERQLGRSREQLVRLTPCDLTVGLGPVRLRELIQPLLDGTMSSRTVDIIRRGPDGSPIPIEVRWQYVALPGERGRIVALGRDIRERLATERRLAELASEEHGRAAELNAIIRTIGEGLLVVDPAGSVTLANPTARSLFGAHPPKTVAELADRLALPEGAGADAILGATSPLEVERRDGAGWLEVSAYPVDAAAPSGVGETILILRDVTIARERDRVRDAFVGVLSHELRTPLTTIFAGAKVLARSDAELSASARAEIFEDIQSEAERLHRLVEDVVALTRFGEGALEIGKEPVLLQRVLPTVARSEQARWPGGVFELDIEPDLPPVTGDPTYVEQVVRNLLANAVKYGAGSAVRVEGQHVDGHVEVRVRDRGPGFPPDEAARLFELYYRSPTVAKQVSGSGLGLFVCARLIEAMGGRIWARNLDEGGAEFGFALRRMDEDGED